MSTLTQDDVQILKASLDNASIFTEYYFGVKLLPHQLEAAHAPHKTVLTLGGRGSGKSFGWGFIQLWLATVIPDYRCLWTSYTADQAHIAFNEILRPYILASERFHKFLPEGEGSLKKKPHPTIYVQIPGSGLPQSFLTFKTSDSGASGDSKRGFTWDAVHIDEGGLIADRKVISTLRASMRGNRVTGQERLLRMSCSTTPTDVDWLREWWEKAKNPDYFEYDPAGFAAFKVSTNDNSHLTDEMVTLMSQDMTPEERQVEIQADFPEYTGSEFSPAVVNACQDKRLNDEVARLLEEGHPEAKMVMVGRSGCISYQKPAAAERHYILSADPGTGNPPYRNAGVVMVFDVTEAPYELVYFSWVAGNGDYRPFFRAFEWAYHYYRPLYAGFDATGTQKAMDQLYLENRNIFVEGFNVTSEKPAMINNAKIFMQRGLLRFPFIQGLRLQLLNYRQEEDRKIAQDIVMTLMMACWKMRQFHYQEAASLAEDGSSTTYGPIREQRLPQRIHGRAV